MTLAARIIERAGAPLPPARRRWWWVVVNVGAGTGFVREVRAGRDDDLTHQDVAGPHGHVLCEVASVREAYRRLDEWRGPTLAGRGAAVRS